MSSTDELCITISSDVASGTNQELSGGNVHSVCTMRIPNRLLLEWNYTDNTITFISKANDHIANKIITLRPTERLEKRLALLARKTKAKIQGALGRKYQEYLQSYTNVYVLEEVLSAQDAIHEKELADKQAQQFRKAEHLRNEVDSISTQLQAFTGSMMNRGKTIDKVIAHTDLTKIFNSYHTM